MQKIPELKLIFIHIPKTGGTFIEKCLRSLYCKLYDKNKIPRGKHNFAGGHSAYFNFANKTPDIEKYNVFCVVRNPYERLLSAYYYLYKLRNEKFFCEYWEALGKPADISKFIDGIYVKYKNNDMQYMTHTRQQYKFILNNDNRFESKQTVAKNCKILKYELLNKDFLKFIEIYRKNTEVYQYLYNHLYKKIFISRQKYNFTVEDIKKINEIYNKDFELFNYEKIIK